MLVVGKSSEQNFRFRAIALPQPIRGDLWRSKQQGSKRQAPRAELREQLSASCGTNQLRNFEMRESRERRALERRSGSLCRQTTADCGIFGAAVNRTRATARFHRERLGSIYHAGALIGGRTLDCVHEVTVQSHIGK